MHYNLKKNNVIKIIRILIIINRDSLNQEKMMKTRTTFTTFYRKERFKQKTINNTFTSEKYYPSKVLLPNFSIGRRT